MNDKSDKMMLAIKIVRFSVFRQRFKYGFIKHDLVNKMPIANKSGLQYFEQSRLVSPIIDRIVSSQIPVAAECSFAPMFEHFDLMQQFVVAVIVTLWYFFLLLGDNSQLL